MIKLGEFFLEEPNGHFFHVCPACDCTHPIAIKALHKPNWDFNGNLEKPTITPSMKITKMRDGYCCHYNITDGKIYYHPDSWHSLAGKTVDMVPIERMKLYEGKR